MYSDHDDTTRWDQTIIRLELPGNWRYIHPSHTLQSVYENRWQPLISKIRYEFEIRGLAWRAWRYYAYTRKKNALVCSKSWRSTNFPPLPKTKAYCISNSPPGCQVWRNRSIEYGKWPPWGFCILYWLGGRWQSTAVYILEWDRIPLD